MRSKSSHYYNQDTYYPHGTECYRDPSQGSCFLFGNSGSGVARRFTPEGEPEQYAFTGPLSMSKSCDQIWILDNKITYSSENPGIFTNAYCYLPWIAMEYGMRLPSDYTYKDSCNLSRGNIRNIDQDTCFGQDTENLNRGRCRNWESMMNMNNEAYSSQQDCLNQTPSKAIGKQIKKCDFNYTMMASDGTTKTFDSCKLFAQEGYAYNIYLCKVTTIKQPSLLNEHIC